nr:hypothetical protein [Clostridia bacterium]
AGALSHDGSIAAISTAQDKVVLYRDGRSSMIGALSGPTKTMAWTRENLLYLMNGNPLRFYWTDPTQTAGSDLTPQLADPYNGLEGRLVGRENVLYLQGEQQNIVYRCNPADASRSACALGYRFEVSQDGSSLVVQTDQGDNVGLKLVDLERSQGEQLIGLGLDLHDFCVSHDGQSVYYLAKEDGEYALYQYDRADGRAKHIMNLPECTLYPTMEAGTLLLNLQKDGVWWVCRLALKG